MTEAASPMRVLRRLLHAFDNYGLRALRPPPLPAPGSSYSPDTPHPFDLAHGVDTSGHIPGEALRTGSRADLYNTAYYAISPSTLTQALTACPIAPSEFTFIDLGCGKGRALLVAAEYGFPGVLGVELSPALAAIARSNTAANPSIRVLTTDATLIEYPPGPLLIFLYHPFLATILRRTLRNLLAQRALQSHPTCILFANPSYFRLFASLPVSLVWTRTFPLSSEDAAADRHGLIGERYSLYRC